MSDEVQTADSIKAQYTPGLARLTWKDRANYMALISATQKGDADPIAMITSMDELIERVAGKPSEELTLDEGNAIQEMIVERFQGNTKAKN